MLAREGRKWLLRQGRATRRRDRSAAVHHAHIVKITGESDWLKDKRKAGVTARKEVPAAGYAED